MLINSPCSTVATYMWSRCLAEMMLSLSLFLLAGVLVAPALGKHAKLPSTFQRCNVTNPEYDDCLLKVTQHAFTVLEHGIPSLGVLPIDPLQITEIEVTPGGSTGRFSLGLSDVFIHGFKNIQVVSTDNDIKKGGADMRADVFIPEFQIISNYKVGGRILFLPISGEGRSNITLRDVRVKATLVNEKVMNDGEEYIRVKVFGAIVSAGKIYVKLENLFGGNEQLGRQMNIFLNENAQDIFSDLKPAIEMSFGEIFKQICNRIFLKVPYKTIFLH